jgi:hypothetical protein
VLASYICCFFEQQDAVSVLKLMATSSCEDVSGFLTGIVLQAPVSDREYAGLVPETPTFLKIAQAMVSLYCFTVTPL